MPLLKNVTGQKIPVFAYDVAAGAGKTGDQANITAQISKDFGANAALTDTNPVQLDATNHPGWYVFDLAQAETNADCIILTVSSTTAGIRFAPLAIYPTVYDATKAGFIDASIAALNNISVANILAGVVNDAQVFASGTLGDLLRKVLWMVVNKLVVVDASGNYTLYKNDGVTVAATGNIADDLTNTTRSTPAWS